LRFCRLYPALILFYLTFLDKFSQVLQTADIKGILKFLGVHLIFAETLIPLKFEGSLVGNTTFHVSWSLGTEFVMYIMFGLLMIIYFRSSNLFYRKLILVTIAAYVITLIYLAFHPPVVLAFFQKIASPKDMTDVEWYRYFFYLSPYFRFGNFLLGVGAAYLVVNQRKMLDEKSKIFNFISVVSFILLLLIFVLDHRFGLFNRFGHAKAPLSQILNSCLIAAILMNAMNKNIVNKILETKVLVQVGIVSYSLYLFHYLVPRFGLTLSLGGVYHSSQLIVHFTNMALNMFVAVVLAFGFFKIVEAPGKKFLAGFLGKN
jgi:peptidoglycan/LPS O-acetylase OafA/YrhL